LERQRKAKNAKERAKKKAFKNNEGGGESGEGGEGGRGEGGEGGGGGSGGGLGSEKEPNDLDPSQLSFDFAAALLTEDPHTGFIHATLTVRLVAGAFTASSRKDRIRAQKKKEDLRDWARPSYWRGKKGDKTEDDLQERSPNPICVLLSKAFPERWGVDELSPVVSETKSELSSCDSQINNLEYTTQEQLLSDCIFRVSFPSHH
jgi:hypothetical protein